MQVRSGKAVRDGTFRERGAPQTPPLLQPTLPGVHPYRHEPFVLIQALLVGGDEEPPVLHPARVQPRLGRQIPADHIPRVRQQLHFHIAGTQLPQETCVGDRCSVTSPRPPCVPRVCVTLRGSCSISWICGNATKTIGFCSLWALNEWGKGVMEWMSHESVKKNHHTSPSCLT